MSSPASTVQSISVLIIDDEREFCELIPRGRCSIDVQISALMRKLRDDPKNPRFICTVRPAGYMLVDPDAPPL
ncbi:MAG TPA: helix-turn-helix domain-containing protein [Verrucomicrobiales bacterium]|jgi:hypothetical protein|nr:helix-turn-helix domain-containing protein [Verrucomicrobiales bacterium]